MLSEIQQKKINHLFQILDTNKNGSLQLDDFTHVSEKIIKCLKIEIGSRKGKLIETKANRLFIQLLIDTHQSELSISLRDWMKFFEKEILSEKQGSLDGYIHRTTFHIFSLFDLNADNKISMEEYANMWSIYGIPKGECTEIFNLLDENGDSVISSQEIINGLNDFFISSDPNAPGNFIFGHWE